MRRPRAPGMPLYASALMSELMRALGGYMLANPSNHGHELVRISCGCEFEGFGRASEAWDLVWTLTLCRIRRHVRMASGWQPASYPDPMTFRGRDDGDCIKQAIQFLRDVPKPQPLNGPEAAAIEKREGGGASTGGELSPNALDDEIATEAKPESSS